LNDSSFYFKIFSVIYYLFPYEDQNILIVDILCKFKSVNLSHSFGKMYVIFFYSYLNFVVLYSCEITYYFNQAT
jgi:hypothetical protein